ncbi:prepilin-type N-terminal cleavage/methylation domain-containing protein [Verrucomicrobium sp. GAS474]|uniref:pilus assembly FimT family protein n=1 Tax=Verrucomicrobium sp. GAS474 TaxID=1882831 RepID=UPI00087D7FCB|nr:prepilin-type N-terminal cleavage/methylation domain-containing protein [Verrucomicrobium sp. GAS474]SDT93979.1 prepilin-type N-terminal cleavage/methylation domain-containing protein [Verrucomicrobium sp. GAS474]
MSDDAIKGAAGLGRGGFSLVELMVVIALVALVTLFAVPSVRTLVSAGRFTSDLAAMGGAIEQARAYAIGADTYVWLGLFEEDGAAPSAKPARPGVGRIVVSVVASRDGTKIYDAARPAPLNPDRLLQVNPLLRIAAHLTVYPDGTGTSSDQGKTFEARPAVSGSRIGDTLPAAPSATSFPYPLSGAPQYTFVKSLQFNPAGEMKINNDTAGFQPITEIGLKPAHGNAVDAASSDLAAVHVAGLTGAVRIYRR